MVFLLCLLMANAEQDHAARRLLIARTSGYHLSWVVNVLLASFELSIDRLGAGCLGVQGQEGSGDFKPCSKIQP